MSKFPLLNAVLTEAESEGFLSRLFGRPSTTTKNGVTKPVTVSVTKSEKDTSDAGTNLGSPLARFLTELSAVDGNFHRVVIRTKPTAMPRYLKKPSGTFYSDMSDQAILSTFKGRRSPKSDFQIMPKEWKFSDQLGNTNNTVAILIDAPTTILNQLNALKGEQSDVPEIRRLLNQISELKYYRMSLDIELAREVAPAIDEAHGKWNQIAKVWNFNVLYHFPRGKSAQTDLENEFVDKGFRESPEAKLARLKMQRSIKDQEDALKDKPAETAGAAKAEETPTGDDAEESEPQVNKTSAADNQKPTDDVYADLKFAIDNWATWKSADAKRNIMDIAEPNIEHVLTDDPEVDLAYIIKNWKRMSDATKRKIMARNAQGRKYSKFKE